MIDKTLPKQGKIQCGPEFAPQPDTLDTARQRAEGAEPWRLAPRQGLRTMNAAGAAIRDGLAAFGMRTAIVARARVESFIAEVHVPEVFLRMSLPREVFARTAAHTENPSI
jgi:hypothetical protein